jgi:hypothetical protein
MTRPKTKAPKYRYHVSGQAFVEFNRKRFYLGKFDTQKSRVKYHRLVTEYLASGLQTPDSETHLVDDSIKVSDLAAEYLEHVRTIHHGKPEPLRSADRLCALLCEHHGKEPADEFGPRKLAAIRRVIIATGNKRNTVNREVREIVRIFKFGVSMELVEPATWQKLRIHISRDIPGRDSIRLRCPMTQRGLLSAFSFLAVLVPMTVEHAQFSTGVHDLCQQHKS